MGFAPIKASAKGGKDFEPIPAGVHMAICTWVIDLGWQPQTGKFPAPKHQVYLKFEIPDHQVTWTKDGKEHTGPGTIGRKFGLSLSEKSHLRPFLVGWRGKEFTVEELEGFDIGSVIGKVCQLNVIHEKGEKDGKTYARIAGAFALVKEQKAALAANPARAKSSSEMLVYSPEAHDSGIYDQLPEWIQKMLEDRVDDPAMTASERGIDQMPGKATEDFDDDIPF